MTLRRLSARQRLATTAPAWLFGSIEPIEIQEEMERSFLDYAMSVIMARALPDVRDGLKPVHRRIIWDMEQQGFRPDRPFVKCARVTGDTMAKYHPHGNSAIYDALVRMAQPFSLRHPLIDFHGNYGSPDFGPAAERYTECRLHPLAMQMVADIDENTVDLVPNYDGTNEEPSVLPARFPNLLVNGSQGIASNTFMLTDYVGLVDNHGDVGNVGWSRDRCTRPRS